MISKAGSPEGGLGQQICSLRVTDSARNALYNLKAPDSTEGKFSLAAEEKQVLVTGLLASHGEQLRRFLASRARQPVDVPDLIQEVYLRMLRVPSVESIRSPEAYLFTVAQHVLQQYGLRRSLAPPCAELDQMLHGVRSSEADPALQLAADQCLEQLQQAFDQLSPKARATFIFHRRDGLSFEEIAARLETSTAMVKKHLMKALVHLRQRIEAPG
jgi:RNA polymerase sigma factor (sigma-70 family)